MSTDEFDGARAGFVKMDDLVGRLLLVTPVETGERESTLPGANGKTYTFVVTDTVVLDGDVNEVVDEVPLVLADFQFSGQTITGQLTPAIRRGRKVLGRLSQQPSQTKGFGKAWVLAEPTEADKAVARAYLASVPKDDVFA